MQIIRQQGINASVGASAVYKPVSRQVLSRQILPELQARARAINDRLLHTET